MLRKFRIATAIAVAAFVGSWWIGSQGGTLLPVLFSAAEAQEVATAPADITIPDMVLGNPDAPVTLTEYASFTCPHCANFHDAVFRQLKTDYIDTGKVKFVYREVYFDRNGLWAAMVARCGGETLYFGISDMLFDSQKDWSHSDDPNAVVANLKKIGRTAGLNDTTLDACLQDGAAAQAMVATYQKNAEADEVNATPTLFIDGTKHSNMTYNDLKSLLDEALGG